MQDHTLTMPSQDNMPDGSTRTDAMLLDQGNRLRDERAWADAAEAYGRYLRQQPADGPIWIQYGHCLKEAGDPQGALLCYREAEKLRPGDSDLQLQIGHALKLLGRQEEAFGAYAMALTLDPGNIHARRELMAGEEPAAPAADAPGRSPPPAAWSAPAWVATPPTLPEPAPVPRPVAAAILDQPLVFDASDLLDYFQHSRAPTGIQRVQCNLIWHAMALAPEAVTVTAFAAAEGGWKALPHALFLRLAELARGGTDTGETDWVAATAAARTVLRTAAPLEFPPGAVLVNLGTSWWLDDYLRRVREAKSRFGIRYVPFLHDCIPLLTPEHCEERLVDQFARWFAGLCLHADAVLVNSASTRDDFRRLQSDLLPSLAIPCEVIPLDAAPDPVPEAPLPPRLRDGRPFVLFVGTIESRKNHLLVFHAWLTLVRRHGALAVPDLVCVGKRGWLAEAALQLHARSTILQDKVRLLHDVADPVLAALYRGCLFTLYNSFYEGWGLPVTESLAHGKVALVPNHSGLRESGAAGAVFFAPNCEPDLVEHAWRLATDPAYRAAQEARIGGQLRLRQWADIAAQVMAAARTGGTAEGRPPLARLGLPLGRAHPLRLLPGPEPTLAMAAADALREGPGWSVLHDWGAWARLGESRLRLPLPEEAAGQALRVFLEVQAPDTACRFTVRAGREGSPPAPGQRFEAHAEERLFAMLTVPAAAEGDLVIALEPSPGAGATAEAIGVCSLMACRADDHAARLDYLESRALARLPGA